MSTAPSTKCEWEIKDDVQIFSEFKYNFKCPLGKTLFSFIMLVKKLLEIQDWCV
jgi:hypothetical protein